jgi:hypothetical protein
LKKRDNPNMPDPLNEHGGEPTRGHKNKALETKPAAATTHLDIRRAASFRIVDWSFLRMNASRAVLARLRAVQAGVSPLGSLLGLASQPSLSTMIARNYTPVASSDRAVSRRTDPAHVPSLRTETAHGAAGNTLVTSITKLVNLDPSPPPGGWSQFAPDIFNPEYHPHSLNLGELKVGEARTAVVTIVAPLDDEVDAAIEDTSHVPGSLTPRFSLARLTSYKGEWITAGKLGARVSVVDQDTRPNGLSGGSLRVHEGQEFTITVLFTPGEDDNGVFPTTLSVSGNRWHLKIPVTANVTLLGDTGAVLVDVHDGSFRTLKGQDVDVSMTLINIGGARTATLSWGWLPTGVSMDDLTIALGSNEQKDAVVHLKVSADAPEAREVASSLNLEYSGLTRQVGLTGSIYDPLLYFEMAINVKSVDGSMEVTVKSDGSWTWHVSLNDHATIIGDSYLVAFGMLTPGLHGGPPEILYRMEQGNLGSATFGPDSSKTIDESGSHPFIRDNFFAISDAGISGYVTISDNPVPFTVALASILVGGAVGVALA